MTGFGSVVRLGEGVYHWTNVAMSGRYVAWLLVLVGVLVYAVQGKRVSLNRFEYVFQFFLCFFLIKRLNTLTCYRSKVCTNNLKSAFNYVKIINC